MAATAQSDPYSIFIRKIGWSVGLENKLGRVSDLTDLYVREKDLTIQAWNHLVHDPKDGWGLKNDHVADFFRSIGLVSKQKNEIHVLPGLDALAIATLELE